MAWYWIVLIIFCYVLLWSLTGVILYLFGEMDEELAAIVGVLWPLVWVLWILVLPFVIVREIIKKFK